MTLKSIADELNTTTMTIYRKLKRAGINIETLRDVTTGEITAAGAGVIASLFGTIGETEPEQEAQRTGTDVANGDVTADAAVLRAQLDGANALIEQLKSERDDLRRQLDAVTAALQAEQNDRAAERKLLTAGPDGSDNQQRRGLLRRLFGR